MKPCYLQQKPGPEDITLNKIKHTQKDKYVLFPFIKDLLIYLVTWKSWFYRGRGDLLFAVLSFAASGLRLVGCDMYNAFQPDLPWAVSICFELCLKIVLWVKEIVHQLRAFAAHTEDTGLVSDNHMVNLECLDLQLQGSGHFPLLISGGTEPTHGIHTCLQANTQKWTNTS